VPIKKPAALLAIALPLSPLEPRAILLTHGKLV
jgi:hypothetical protein